MRRIVFPRPYNFEGNLKMEALPTIPSLYIEWLKYPSNIFAILRAKQNISIMFVMLRNQLYVLFQQHDFRKVREIYLQGMDINGLQVIRMRRKLENIDSCAI